MPDGSRLPYELNINYLDALSNPHTNDSVELAARKFLTAQAILLSLQGLPAIYFHSLFGSRGDLRGAEASGMPRRINRQKLDRHQLDRELHDTGSLRSRVFEGHRELPHVRRAHPAFAPGATQRVLDLDPRVFALLQRSQESGDEVLCLHNVSEERVPLRLEAIAAPSRQWAPLWGLGPSIGGCSSLMLDPCASGWLSTAATAAAPARQPVRSTPRLSVP